MKVMEIYLCGGMGKFGKECFDEANTWRLYCKESLENYDDGIHRAHVINPNDYFNFLDEKPQYKSNLEVMKFDLHKLRKSDLIIVNFNDMWSLGSMSEIAIAYERRIPIIGLDIDNQDLHPWQKCMCERIFNNIDEMLDYVEDFYLN